MSKSGPILRDNHIEWVGFAVTLYTSIREVLGSNVGQDISYPD
jgi:hypothetical protein